MSSSPELFGRLLTEAVYRIRSIEAKSIAVVQDELGYAIGREKGGSAIEYWRKNHVPESLAEIEALAREIALRTDLSRAWVERFLRTAAYPYWRRLCDELFPSQPAVAVVHEQEPEPLEFEMPLAPFVAGPPIINCRQFFGRDDELRRLFGVVGRFPLQHVAIIGQQRSGKTSLLHYLKQITRTTPNQRRPGQRADWLRQPERYHWVYVDFQDIRMGQIDVLLPYILNELRLPVPESCTLGAFMDVVSQKLREPAVILLDEIGSALDAPDLDMRFWWSLRSLCTTQTSGLLGFVLTSQQPPVQQAQSYGKPSPFFNIFQRMDLGPLTEAAARELIDSSPRPFDAVDIEWILEESRRWPALVQMLCSARLLALELGMTGVAWREEGLQQIAPYRYLFDSR
jgi:hypothetical protein